MWRPSELVIAVENARKLLRFTTTIANLGQGAIELMSKSSASGRTDAYQRLYTHDANCQWSSARTNFVGTFQFHAEHDHWHFENFAQYELRNVAANGSAGSTIHAASGKVSFCLMNSLRVDSRLRHAASQTYTVCDQTRPQGISVGWADVYQWYSPGQSLDITEVPDGEYWLVSTADPSNVIDEGGGAAENHNTAAAKVRIQGHRVTVTE